MPDPSDTAAVSAQHTRLLRDVQRRATAVLALIDEARVRPHDELATLAQFARDAVEHQAEHEEQLVFPAHIPGEAAARLAGQHAALRSRLDALEQARARRCSLPELRQHVSELLAELRQHVADEEALLGVPRPSGAEGDEP